MSIRYFVLQDDRLHNDDPRTFAQNIVFSIAPAAPTPGDLVWSPIATLRIVSVVICDSGDSPAYDQLSVATWELNPPRGCVSLETLLGQGDSPDVLTRSQRALVRTALKTASPMAWARASENVRAALGSPEPFLSITEAHRETDVPMMSIADGLKAGRIYGISRNGKYLVRASEVRAARRENRVKTRPRKKAEVNRLETKSRKQRA